MSSVHVVRPGLQTTIQDRGRWGWQSSGVPVSGAMDPDSCRVANALVGNDADAAVLEIAFVGPELEFDDGRLVAAAGAAFVMSVDGSGVPVHAGFPVVAGSRLRFGDRISGARAYLAISGGIAVPTVFGSRSTHLVSRMGGLDGRALVAGDRLPLGEQQSRMTDRLKPRPAAMVQSPLMPATRPMGTTTARVRVIADAGLDRFVEGALDVLQSAPYTIGQLSDRMGFRLEGPRLLHVGRADRLSDVTPLGSLQVPESGQPILLMADRQTTGGYARIATVISADIGVAGQLGPGDRVEFEVCTLRDALTARIAAERAFMATEGM